MWRANSGETLNYQTDSYMNLPEPWNVQEDPYASPTSLTSIICVDTRKGILDGCYQVVESGLFLAVLPIADKGLFTVMQF